MPENKPKRTYEEVQAEVNSKLKEKKAYQARIKSAINHIKDDPEKINKLKKYLEDRTKGSTDINGYCISSACYTLNEAKELLSYVSGTNLQKDIVSGKLPGWKIDYDLNNLEEGDILQQDRLTEKGGRGAPYHTMLTENVGKDKSGNVTDIRYFGSSGRAESFDSHDIERSTIDKFKKDKNYQIIKKEFVPNSLLKERDMLKPFVQPRVEKYKDYVPNEQIKYLGSNDESEDKRKNRTSYIDKMMGRKEELMKAYNLSNNEYNDLVKLSAGILDQESEYGTSTRYKLKNIPGVQFAGKWVKGETLEAFDPDEYSVGPGQSKPKYFPSKAGKKFGITPESEEATLITVLDRYSNQVPSNLKGAPAGYLKTANVYKGMSSDNNEYAKSVLDKAASFGLSNYDQSKASFNDIKNKERVKKQEVMQQSFAPAVKQENFVNVKKEPVVKFKYGGVLRVTDKNDPRLIAYNDSLSNYNKNEILWRGWQPVTPGNAEQLNTFYEPGKVYRERTDPNLPGYDINYKNVVKKPVRTVILEDKPKLEPIKPLGIKPMNTFIEPKLAGNVTVPVMYNTKGVTQNYTGSKALQIQDKPSGYTNKGDRTGRQEFRKGGWLDGIPSIKPNFQTIWDTDKDILEFRRVFKERFGEEPGTEDGGVYNIQEAVMNGERPRLDKSDGLYHWSDKYKLPDHPTFSNQSKYYKPGMKAVKWVNEEPVNIETQNYTGSKALKIQGKPTGYVNIGDGTGRKEIKRNGGWLDGLEEGKTTQAPDVTNATEYIKNWYNSPMYGNILRNQIADAGIKSPKRTERIVKRFSENFNQDLNNSFYNVTPSVVRNPEEYGTGYIDNKGKKQINLDKNFVEGNPKLVNSLFAHELAHDNLITYKDKEYVNKNTPEYNPAIHDEIIYNKLTDPGEVRSQIHSIRQLSGENKIYDPLTQPFKKEYLDKVNESYNQGTKDSENYNQLKRLRKYYSDDQITEMMNTISKSNSNDGKVYARNGGLLDGLPNNKFYAGGITNGLDTDNNTTPSNVTSAMSALIPAIQKSNAQAANTNFNANLNYKTEPTAVSTTFVNNNVAKQKAAELAKDIKTYGTPEKAIIAKVAAKAMAEAKKDKNKGTIAKTQSINPNDRWMLGAANYRGDNPEQVINANKQAQAIGAMGAGVVGVGSIPVVSQTLGAGFAAKGVHDIPQTVRTVIDPNVSLHDKAKAVTFNAGDFLGFTEGVKGAKALKNVYNTVAKGESFLPIAWKSPAVGLSEEASQNMFKNVFNNANLTDAERAVVADYQYNSRLYTGRNGNIDPVKKQAINDIIKKYNIKIENNAIATRMFNPENNSLGATLDKGRLNFGDRPTSFTIGAKGSYGSGATDRLVIPNTSLKKMGDNFVKNTYEPLSEDALKLVDENSRNWAAGIGKDNAMLGNERELIGTGLDFKRIGKVKNDVGGYDWIVKPKFNKKSVKPTTASSATESVISNSAKPIESQAAKSWQMEELPGLHLQSTMENGAVSKIVEPKTGLINTEQALAIIGKESGGADKVALIKKGLGESVPKKMDYNDFRKLVQEQLIPLERQFSEHASNYGVGQLGYPSPKRSSYESAIKHNEEMIENYKKQIALGNNDLSLKVDLENAINNLKKSKEELAKLPLENQTIILSNKRKFGRGSAAHGNPDETLGHAHFLRDAETPDVLTVTQIQSDAFQGTHRIMPDKTKKVPEFFNQRQEQQIQNLKKSLEEEKAILNKYKTSKVDDSGYPIHNSQIEQIEKSVIRKEQDILFKEAELKNLSQKQLLDKNHQERYLQELVDYAGKRGDVSKVRLPTSETAAKVQGYNTKKSWNVSLRDGDEVVLLDGTKGKVTDDLFNNSVEITTVDGKKINIDMSDAGYSSNSKKLPLKSVNNTELKELSSYDQEQMTILKKYSEQPKTIKKLFGKEPTLVTDSKGNTWYEFDIPEKFKKGKAEIKAFTTIGAVLGAGALTKDKKQNGGWLDNLK